MSDLREALETIVAERGDGWVYLESLLAAHPVEPAAKSAREIARDVHERFAPLRESALHIPAAKPSKSEAPAPVQVKVPDEIVDIAVNAYLHDPGDDPVSSMRAALEAVAPRSLLDREAVTKVLREFACWKDPQNLVKQYVADLLELARPMPTREWLAAYFLLQVQTLAKGEEWYLADRLLALLNGTGS